MSKKISFPITIIIIIVCAVLVGGIVAWQYYEMPKGEEVLEGEVSEELPEDETADWNVYRSEEYGFEIKYPKDWHAEVHKVEIKRFAVVIFQNYPFGEESFEKEDRQTIELRISEASINEYNEWLDLMKEVGLELQEITVGSVKGYKATSRAGSITVTIAKDKYIYYFVAISPDVLADKVFNQMLSTFTLY